MRIGSRFVHSRYDPLAEARVVAERTRQAVQRQGAGFLIVIGSGLGYLPSALRRLIPDPILLWDPFPSLTRSLGIGFAQPDPRLERVEEAAAFANTVARWARPGQVPLLLIHPGYEELCCFEARFAARELRRVFHTVNPLSIEEAVVSRRAIEALARFPYQRTVEALDGALTDQTVILVSPGPSLESALPLLRARPGGVVVAAVQALRPLAEADVQVDLAVAPDPGDYASHLAGVEPRFGALLAESSVDPSLLDRWSERAILFHLRTPHLQQIAWESCGLPILDEPFVTVSEIALVLTHRLGARRFVMVGIDLCPDEDYYPVRFLTRDRLGQPVRTNSTYFHAARYLAHLSPQLVRDGCEIWRWGEGLPIPGTEPISAADLRTLLGSLPRFAGIPSDRRIEPERWKRAHDLLRSAAAGTAAAPRARFGASGGHPASRDLDPLEGSEREIACARAVAHLESNPPPG